jgi:hypothetical protein
MNPDARVLVYAKPSAADVFPYSVFVLAPEISSKQVKKIVITGHSFYEIRSVYLSGSDPNIFQALSYRRFDPFAQVPRLSVKNPPFSGSLIPTFNVLTENILEFEIPDSIFYIINNKTHPYDSLLDVIVENEAGYGLLTRDSITNRVSSWRGFFQEQKPCISGIYISTP